MALSLKPSICSDTCLQIWGNAYADSSSTIYSFHSFATPSHEMPMEPYLYSNQLDGPMRNMHTFSSWSPTSRFPDAHEKPLFYIAVYGCIGLATAMVGVSSAIAQYTGALRASRILFKQLLVGVVRATMRWHDVTPQGMLLLP